MMYQSLLKKMPFENHSAALSYAKGITLILLMILASQLFKDKEIILPEMAALSIGCFFYNLQEWRSKPWHLFVLPTITAFIGFYINSLPIPISVKLVLSIGAVVLVMFIFKNILLPVITNCHSPLFLVSIILFTLILALSVILSKKEIDENVEHHSFKEKKIEIMLFLIVVMSWFYLCNNMNQLGMMAIPPVIVVALESVLKKKYSFKILLKQIFTLTIAGLAGSYILFFIDNKIAAVLISILMVSALLRIMKFRLPPAYAMGLLPMVLHQQAPEVFALNIFIMAVSILGLIFILKNEYLKSVFSFSI